MSNTPREDELPELPDDALPELPEESLPELPEEALPELTASPAPTAPLAPGEQPPLRVITGAPLHLQKAALICMVGGILPWQSLDSSTVISYGLGKVLLLAGIWLLWKSVDQRAGAVVPGFVASLGGIVLGKKKVEDPKVAARRAARQKGPTKLDVPFPTALHIIGLLIVIIGCLMPLFDSVPTVKIGPDMVPHQADVFEARLRSLAELGMLAWAAGTWVHIYAYERWGSFNPIFPMIFIGMLMAGFATAIKSMFALTGGGEMTGPAALLGVVGGLVVGVGGGMAAYTIVEAMMDAKREGDAKKAAESNRRKAARDARKSG